MAVVDFADNYQRADTASGLGVTSTGQKPYRQDAGSSRISGGQALLSSGLASVDAEVPDVDASLTLSRDGYLAVRVVDAANLVRLRAVESTSTRQEPFYVTEYEWQATYGGFVAGDTIGDPNHHPGTSRYFHSSTTVRDFWSRSTSQDPTPSSRFSAQHSHGGSTNFHELPRTASQTTGVTRQTLGGYNTVTTTSRRVRLERVTAGNATVLGDLTVAAFSSPVRVVTRRDGALLAYYGSSQFYTGTEQGLATATRVGVGSVGTSALDSLVVTTLLKPPTAPTDLAPNTVEPVDLSQVLVLSWRHNDADPQAGYTLRLRPVGSTGWAVLAGGAESTRALTPGTLTPGQYEWEVETTDSTGLTSPTSARAFFTAAVPPSTPQITSPSGVVTSGSATTAWTAAAQEAYRLRVLADENGQPGAVLSDTGIMLEPGARSREIQHPVNGRVEHVQVQVRASGLWSGWASVRVTVTYTPPPVPSGALDNTGPWMRVQLLNDQPRGTQPAVARNELYRRARGSGDGTGLRVAVGLAPNAGWDDPHLAHLEDVEYRAVAIGVNGTQSGGEWFDLVGAPPVDWDAEDFIDDEFETEGRGTPPGVYDVLYPESY